MMPTRPRQVNVHLPKEDLGGLAGTIDRTVFQISSNNALTIDLYSVTIKLEHFGDMERVTEMASERPVVIFAKSSCDMCYSVQTLFTEFGVNPAVHELDVIPKGTEIEQALSRQLGRSPSVPAVFIGGKLVGGVSEVMSLHLSRSLIPLLKKAGALWV
ncbi:hypothetical protein SAY87_023732 [Trapa incisa]|uniref:Glutaredoxin domain-containing protein n=1 Tax=Trapa incisa TaxID=236973 RepID=A0AAN7QSE8_9MYRT|nr:hypothetical protein SAY87_023732 [Trapa incisa]